MKKKVEIIKYRPSYKDDFREISYEWLNQYDILESKDILIIENVEQEILNDGGQIFLAKIDNEIVGTASLINIDDETVELAKFGVKDSHQGNGIGTKLINKCITVAKKLQNKKIILETVSVLESSIYLYEKFGFEELDSFESKYETTDKLYELVL